MSLSKLKRIHVIIIGIVLMIIAGVALFFLQVRPQIDAYKVFEKRYEKAAVKGNERSRQQAMSELGQAVVAFQGAQKLLDMQMRRRMPSLNFSRRDIGMLALWNEQIKTLGPLLEDFAQDENVTVLQSGFKLDPPPATPNDAVFDYEMLRFQPGSMSVMGDFKRVMANIRRWNNCGRLVMVGPPKLAGVSPTLTATYDLTCYIFPVAKGGPMIQMAGGGTAAPGTPGTPPPTSPPTGTTP